MSRSQDERAEADAELAAEQARVHASRGDLRGAVEHIATALAFDPMRGEWLEVLEQMGRSVDDGPALAPLETETRFAMAAVRAYLLARADRLGESLPLLLAVAAAQPEVPYLTWATGWLGKPEAGSTLSDQGLAGILRAPLAAYLQILPDRVEADSPTFENLDALAVALELLARAHPDHVPRLLALSAVCRRLGRADEALAAARRAAILAPHPMVLAQLANVHRARGELEETVATYERALAGAPDELAIRLDLGDALLEHGRAAEAASRYEDVLARAPDHRWALPSLWAARAIETGDGAWRDRLIALVEEQPDNLRAAELLAALRARDRAH